MLPATAAEQAEVSWRELEERLGPGGLACSWLWTATWLGQFGELVPHRFAIAESDGRTCGAALVTAGVGRRGPWRVRTVHLGTAGLEPPRSIYVECNRLLVEDARREAFAWALIQRLTAERDWDELVLDGFVVADAELLMAAEPSFEADRQPSPCADLGALADNGDVTAGLSKGTRQKLRRSVRNLGEDVQVEWAATVESALAIFDELVELHQRRWTAVGKPGAFADGRVRGFHRDLIARLMPDGVVLFRARAPDGSTVGCLYGHIEDGRLLFQQSGLASFDDSRTKPGLTVHALCMQECLDRGLAEYDFLAGDSFYKRQLSNREHTLVWAVARRRRLRLILLEQMRRLRAWWRRRG